MNAVCDLANSLDSLGTRFIIANLVKYVNSFFGFIDFTEVLSQTAVEICISVANLL